MVFWFVVRLRRGWWHGCMKCAVECLLVFVVVLVLFAASYVLQDVWVWHYFWNAVLISDRVVVTCSMIFSDLSVERAVSWKVFGDGDVKDRIAVIWIVFVGIVLFEKICFPFCVGIFGSRFEGRGRALLPWWDASAFVLIIIWFCIRIGRVLFVNLFFGYCIIVELLSFETKKVFDVWFGWGVLLCFWLICWWNRLLCVSCAAACVRLWNFCHAGAESDFYRCGSNARFWRVTMIRDLSLTQ